MINHHTISRLKLSLDALDKQEGDFDLVKLQAFLSEEQMVSLIDKFSEELNLAWEQYIQEPELIEKEALEIINDNEPSSDLSTDDAKEIEEEIKTEKVTDVTTFETENIAEKNKLTTDISIKSVSLEKSDTTTSPKEVKMNPMTPPVRFKLPNATVNKNYSATLQTVSNEIIIVTKIDGLDDLGLNYEVENNLLSGSPLLAGDHQLTIHYQFKESTYSAQINLIINNDPKSLWKNIASDKEVKYWKADEDNQGLNGLYEWKLVAASKRGRSHAHVGSCRDDDFALKVDEDSHWHIAAVADGAGSSEYSREGAKVIVNHSSEILTAQLKQHDARLMELLALWQQDENLNNEQALAAELYEVFAPAIISSIDKLVELAETDQRSFRDYYSTLLIAAHKPMATGSFSLAYWIGDGGLAIYKAGKAIKLLGEGDSGDYAGQTRFLDVDAKNPEDIKKRLRFSFDNEFTALVLMSDGISDPLFETDNNLKQLEHWDVFWSNDIQPELVESPETSAAQLEKWLDFWSQGNHDDRTLALIYR